MGLFRVRGRLSGPSGRAAGRDGGTPRFVSAARRRWSLVETDLGDPVGHEQGFRRPVLIVSNEAFNRASGLTTVLPVTSVKPGRPLQPFEVFLPAGAAGNPVDSIVLPHQIRTISAGRLRH